MKKEDIASVKCKYANKCGGCDYQGVEYSRQLEEKYRKLKELLGKYCKIEPIIGMKDPVHYRCKVTGTYAYLKSGKNICGVYEKGTHRVIDIEDCLITDERANAILRTICDMLKSFKIRTYNEDTGFGLLRHVQIRVGKVTGQIMVVLVISNPTFPSKRNFVKVLCDKHQEISTVVLNINDKRTSMVLGERNIVVYGKGYIEDELCGMRFKISPNSFYQVNPVQTEVLYSIAMEYAKLTGTEYVLDAYSGTGTIGLIASKDAKEVVSVELNGDAVKDAIENSKKNGIGNVRFVKADATQYIGQLCAAKQHIDVVFMDPPRSGSTKEFINAVASLGVERVVYVSCGPDSLARDLDAFVKKGYKVEKIQPVDMFGFTSHVETVVLMSKVKS